MSRIEFARWYHPERSAGGRRSNSPPRSNPMKVVLRTPEEMAAWNKKQRNNEERVIIMMHTAPYQQRLANAEKALKSAQSQVETLKNYALAHQKNARNKINKASQHRGNRAVWNEMNKAVKRFEATKKALDNMRAKRNSAKQAVNKARNNAKKAENNARRIAEERMRRN